MKSRESAKTGFRFSETEPPTEWGHTGYITVEPKEEFTLDGSNELVIFFTPRPGATFEQVEELRKQMEAILDKVHFNIFPPTRM
jgi:hypothetical protein